MCYRSLPVSDNDLTVGAKCSDVNQGKERGERERSRAERERHEFHATREKFERVRAIDMRSQLNYWKEKKIITRRENDLSVV